MERNPVANVWLFFRLRALMTTLSVNCLHLIARCKVYKLRSRVVCLFFCFFVVAEASELNGRGFLRQSTPPISTPLGNSAAVLASHCNLKLAYKIVCELGEGWAGLYNGSCLSVPS